ncbi:uncharacterized protein LOC128180198 isoform X3 [Crassostrea angulata]|uniref:uncharacterized protein LOC128180198 isoform X3 n=1 Tax=Magallana angulata TaxID=2784310 RepID=UPI0022B1B248|nr:uncharacterized protein LOC128180198 isoform X3 [Crassostrea angulata]
MLSNNNMDRDFYILLVLVLLQYQMCECGNRYCKEAVNSVEIVTACPTSKTEWEIAARKKNCERIASRQKCDSRERFKYHCVINGFRNKMVEVCAPLRIIFVTDCYKLVTNGENLSTTPKYASTSSTSGSIINIKPGSVETLIIIAAVHLVLFLIFIIIVAFSNYKFFPCCSLTRQPTSSCSHRL